MSRLVPIGLGVAVVVALIVVAGWIDGTVVEATLGTEDRGPHLRIGR